MTAPALLWRPTTTNAKTGNVPTAYLRHDIAAKSCEGCPHDPATGDGSCYAWRGRVAQGFRSMGKAWPKNPHRYTLRAALAGRAWSARMARLTAIGDLTAAPVAELVDAFDQIAAAGLAVVGYTAHHAKPEHAWLRRHVLASTTTDEATDDAHARGWTVAQTIPAEWFASLVGTGRRYYFTDAGTKLLLCPHMEGQAKANPEPVTCNACRACEAGKGSFARLGIAGVVFAEHGPHAKGRAWMNIVRAARERRRLSR